MSTRACLGAVCLGFGVLSISVQATTVSGPTLIKLNANAAVEDSWGRPLINNAGQIVVNERNTSTYGGYIYAYDPATATLNYVTGTGYADGTMGNWGFNNAGQFVYHDTDYNLHTGTLSAGEIRAYTPGYHYAADVNDSATIAAMTYVKYAGNAVEISTDNLLSVQTFDSTTHLSTSVEHVDINNVGDIAYRHGSSGGTVYRVNASGTKTAIGTASGYSPVAMDDFGRVLYGNGTTLYLGSLAIHTVARGDFGFGLAISDHGRVAWAEYDGTRSDVWTFVDGVATNITAGLFTSSIHAMQPDINDQGQIVFTVVNGTYESDVYLWSNDAAESPTVYNGHFDGNTFYGWDVATAGAATASLVLRDADNYAARLVTGSPVTISQYVDTPSGEFYLSFDAKFESPTILASLDVLLNDDVIAHLDGVVGEFQSYQFLIDNVAMMNLDDATLSFRWDGDAGAVLLLDNVSLSAVPEPGTALLLTLGVMGLRRRVC
jgi:hypothetical protein